MVAGRLLGTPELTTLGISAAALIGGAAMWTRSRTTPLELLRSVRPGRVHVGGDARVDLEIVALARSPQVTITDAFDDGRRAARFLTPALERGQRGRAAYRIPTDRRGRFSIGPAVVGIADPFGLTARVVALGDADEVVVAPRVHELRAARGAPGERRASASRRAAVPVASPAHDEFLALREYAVGDDLRRIHWRTTARTGDLMVREDEAAWQPHTIVILDNRVGVHHGPSYEAAIEATASIGIRLQRSGRNSEITTTSGRTIGHGPTGGVSRESRLLDELAGLTPEVDSSLGPMVARLRATQRRGLIVIVTGAPTDVATFTGLASPSTPIVLVVCAEGLAPAGANPSVVDGRPGQFVASWNAAMTRTRDTRRRGVSA